MKDILNILGFILLVAGGAWLINSFILRSFDVRGPSMQDTLQTGDRVIVSRLQRTWSLVSRRPYQPGRGQIIVFQLTERATLASEKHIVKRVIGLPGERVVIEGGRLVVYNKQHPAGFEPDTAFSGPTTGTSDQVDTVVPEDSVFVAGDNRADNFSLDSRNGLGAIPLADVQGPVVVRVFPFDRIRSF